MPDRGKWPTGRTVAEAAASGQRQAEDRAAEQPTPDAPAPCPPLLARFGRKALATQLQRWWRKWSGRASLADAAVSADLKAAAA
eukprot:15444578-Alexandrium_andersonii.AAC.1